MALGFFSGSPNVRADQLRESAARVNTLCLIRPAKCYAPFLSPQKVSEARNRGGALGDLAVQLAADPMNARRYIAWLEAQARALTVAVDGCLRSALLSEAQADAREDVSGTEVLANPDDPDALRRHIDNLDDAIAEAQRVRDLASRRLAELEREGRRS